MRISDWSSDVCSSDLLGIPRRGNEIGRLFVDRKGLHLRLPLRIEKGKAKNGVGGEFPTRGTPTDLPPTRPLLCLQRSRVDQIAPAGIFVRRGDLAGGGDPDSDRQSVV